MTSVQASVEVNEKAVNSNLQDRRRKGNPEFQSEQIARTADNKEYSRKRILKIGATNCMQ